jgi:hypothetical protein
LAYFDMGVEMIRANDQTVTFEPQCVDRHQVPFFERLQEQFA